ncbi:unnamed protein product [Paramecium sonneborni]|uniref:Uncharacterized protein n=1 Tax=Paramecium sonneborni TaxID=65129 RepID=A0A8S1MTH9_9CILI|nr:unnamed protein product [Paramecium sonneborni]
MKKKNQLREKDNQKLKQQENEILIKLSKEYINIQQRQLLERMVKKEQIEYKYECSQKILVVQKDERDNDDCC